MADVINFDDLKNMAEDMDDIFTIETDDGEVDLKIVDELERDGKTYVLLVVLDDKGEETDEAAVFELTKDEEGFDVIESIEDDWLLDALYEEFGVGVEDEE